jgi:glycerol-3-phosphate cytidylyltransferase-like family protein
MDKKYIEIYNKLGCEEFGKGDDQQLKDWGNSEEDIRKMKIECVKTRLELYKTGIDCYKLMNELCGGSNVL